MELEKILVNAGERTSPPPQGSIPRQWVPGWIRWPLRFLCLPAILLDLFAQQVACLLIRPPLKREGKCLKRGNCCYYILLEKPKGVLGALHFFWNTQILGFYPRNRQDYVTEGKTVWLMGCRYLQANGACGHYHLRPSVCRKWPIIEHFGYPRLLKGCGFTFRERTGNRNSPRQSLEDPLESKRCEKRPLKIRKIRLKLGKK